VWASEPIWKFRRREKYLESYRDSNPGSTKPERKKHRKVLNFFCHFQCDLSFPQKFRKKFSLMLEGSDQYTFLDWSGEMLHDLNSATSGQAKGFSFTLKHPAGSVAHQTSYSTNTKHLSLNWLGDLGVKLIIRVHLELRLRMDGYSPLIPHISSCCSA